MSATSSKKKKRVHTKRPFVFFASMLCRSARRSGPGLRIQKLKKDGNMYKKVSIYEFRECFKSIRPNQFTYEGLDRLYNYFIDLEEETGVENEFDVIAVCCEFVEYEDRMEICDDYGIDEENMTNEEVEEWVAERTVIVAWQEGCYLIGRF